MKISQVKSIVAKHAAWLVPVSIVAVGGIIAGVIWWTAQGPPKTASTIAGCKDTSGIICYKTYLTTKTQQQDAVSAITELRNAYNADSYAASQCHELTHIIGRAAFHKYGSISTAYTKGDSYCWSGYYHGVTEEAIGQLGADKVRESANQICADLAAAEKYSFNHYNCVHGLGHGFMAVESFDLFKALKTCDTLNDPWERESCFGGVFMENVMVAVRGDGSSAYLKPDQPLYPCTAVEDPYKQSCYLMQTSYVLQQNSYDFAKTFTICKDMKDANYSNTCYESIGRDAAGSTNSDIARTKANCSPAPNQTALHYCVIGAVRNFVSYFHSDVQAKEYCNVYADTLQSDCLEEVANYYKAF